jgi:adenosylcobinamide-GDP ribazoletransferase
MRGLRTALMTLTRIPVHSEEEEDFSSSLPWFPFVGLILGLLLFTSWALWDRMTVKGWAEGGAALLLAAQIWLTRGLHADGLADWADALGGHRRQEERLLILKDVHLGTFGVLALIITCALKWAALKRLITTDSLIWILPVMSISRDMMVELITTLPYARKDAGMARPFVEGASNRHRILSHLIAISASLFFGPMGMLLYAAGMITARFFRFSFQKGFGGITGDLLGTANGGVETGLLIILCVLPEDLILRFGGWNWVCGGG